jgi:hypothetical protein
MANDQEHLVLIPRHDRHGSVPRDHTLRSQLSISGDNSMIVKKNTQFNRMRKPKKRVLVGETPEEEAARLEREIAAHPVTRCEPGKRNPSSSRPGWSSEPFIPLSERVVAEGIAKKIMKKG